MASQYELQLCFIKPVEANKRVAPQRADDRLRDELEKETKRMFRGSKRYVTVKREEGLVIALVELSGLTHLRSEEEVLQYMEERMESPVWDTLNGYQLAVRPQVDAGSCRLKDPGKQAPMPTSNSEEGRGRTFNAEC